ncbi:RNA ligase, DRB0094 family [Xylariaceae sp. AK1471]|nr:RNA ligase, DRB0094 family [Xylariaceae sp. AK1471]
MTSLAIRRLVSVRKVTAVTAIPNANQSVVVKIGGWSVVTPRSAGFQDGQLVVYVEIDSVLPNTDPFWEYYVSNSRMIDGKRICLVRTAIIKKQLSQGLVFPLNHFSQIVEIFNGLKGKYSLEEAERILMTKSFEDILDVKKFEYPSIVTLSTRLLGPSPVFIEQPGAHRAQNIRNLFIDKGDLRFNITEKLDGIPMSVYMVQPGSQWWTGLPVLKGATSFYENMSTRIGVCGRFEDYAESDNCEFWKAAKSQGIIDGMKRRFQGRNIVVQGELCGSSILGNTMGFPPGKHHFYVFDIYNIDKQEYFTPLRVLHTCSEEHWDIVPVIEHSIKLNDFAKDVDDLLKKAEGNGKLGKMREGLVFKSLHGRCVFKAISNPWLLMTGKKV